MYCKQCKVNIKGNVNICPLCHETVVNDDLVNVMTFPVKIKPLHNPMKSFSRIYFFLALNFTIIFTVINLLWLKEYIWSILMTAVLIYLYSLVKNIILSKKNIGIKVFSQSVFISLMCILIQWIFKTKNEWCFTYAIPLISFLSILVLGIVSFFKIQDLREFLVYFLGISFIGLVPVFFVLIKKNIIIYWPTVVSALTSFAIITSLLFFFSKDLWLEIKKRFHL